MIEGKEGVSRSRSPTRVGTGTCTARSSRWSRSRPRCSAGRRAQQPTIFCRSSQKKAPVEWQDRFAAALLMPAADVRATVRALCGHAADGKTSRRSGRPRVLDEKLRDLATEVMAKGNFTNVSNGRCVTASWT